MAQLDDSGVFDAEQWLYSTDDDFLKEDSGSAKLSEKSGFSYSAHACLPGFLVSCLFRGWGSD